MGERLVCVFLYVYPVTWILFSSPASPSYVSMYSPELSFLLVLRGYSYLDKLM